MLNVCTEDLHSSDLSSPPGCSTISSVGSTELTLDGQEAGVFTEHPLSSFGGIVKVLVQQSFFLISCNILTQNSAYFAFRLSEQCSEVISLDLTDQDVSSEAFGNLLLVLSPPQFGVQSVSTFEHWTDVLHLATKWDFTAVRESAIQAIFPLSSPVDRVVLGHVYKVQDWLVDAFVDVIMGEEDLTQKECTRLSGEDLRIIMMGLRQLARMNEIPVGDAKRKIVVDIVLKQLGLDGAPGVYPSAHVSVPTVQCETARDDQDAERSQSDGGIGEDNERNIQRWIGHAIGTSKSNSNFGRACLVQFASNNDARQARVLDLLLEEGLKQYESTQGKTLPKGVATICTILNLCKSTWTNAPFNNLARAAGLRLVDNWHACLDQQPKTFVRVIAPALHIQDMFLATRYIHHIVDKSLMPCSIFSVFWETMLSLLRLCKGMDGNSVRLDTGKKQDTVRLVDVLSAILAETSAFVFTNAACLEIDTFYQALERECRQYDMWELREKLIKERKWPSDFCS